MSGRARACVRVRAFVPEVVALGDESDGIFAILDFAVRRKRHCSHLRPIRVGEVKLPLARRCRRSRLRGRELLSCDSRQDACHLDDSRGELVLIELIQWQEPRPSAMLAHRWRFQHRRPHFPTSFTPHPHSRRRHERFCYRRTSHDRPEGDSHQSQRHPGREDLSCTS